MLSNALALSILTVASFIAIYNKLPRKLRRLIEKYDVVTDICALLATYWFLGGTLTALIAGSMVGLITSGLLHIVKNPNDYLYLFYFKEQIKKALSSAKDALDKYGKNYRQQLIDSGAIAEKA